MNDDDIPAVFPEYAEKARLGGRRPPRDVSQRLSGRPVPRIVKNREDGID